MKIGINSRIFQNGETGIPYFIRHLYKTLIDIDQKNKYLFLQVNNIKTLGETKTINIPGNHFGNVLFDNLIIDKLIKHEKIDIFHGPSHILPLIKRKKTKYVVTIHDLSFLVFPEQYSKLFNIYYHKAIGYSLQSADVVVADSLSTRDDIHRFYSIDKSRIRVIPLGVSNFFLSNENIRVERIIRENYFFSLTTHPKRKNIHSVLKVFARSKKMINLKFVIAGLIPDAYLLELKKEINDLKLNDKVFLFGYATEAQLKNLYQHAVFFVYPSFYEGFGFPILESMACGTPVIASGTSSMSEIMPQTEWQINPHDLDDLKDKMERIIDVSSSHREEIINQNLDFSKNFTWKKTATEYMKLYEELR